MNRKTEYVLHYSFDILYLLQSDNYNQRSDSMTDNEKLDLILQKVTDLDQKVTDLDQKVTDLDQKVTDLDQKVTDLDQKVTVLEKDVTDIKLTIENEIRVNIQRVAEGHLDLSRKLNEYINISNIIKDKQEIQDIYINMHNNKLKAL